MSECEAGQGPCDSMIVHLRLDRGHMPGCLCVCVSFAPQLYDWKWRLAFPEEILLSSQLLGRSFCFRTEGRIVSVGFIISE